MNELKLYGAMGDSWNDAVQKLLKKAKEANPLTKQFNDSTEFKEVKIDQYGKVSISRTLAGKTIQYRVKQS